jgi:DNA polymerase-3 subunit delta'
VAIVDSADEMNPNAANALLKVLEEPPADVTLLLVSHQPSGLLPTIRSRCRELRLVPMAPREMAEAMAAAGGEASNGEALATLAGGSVGAAIRLANLDGLEIYARMVALFTTLPRLDRAKALQLAESASGRGLEQRLDLLMVLFDLFLARLARFGVAGAMGPEAAPGEAALLARLSPDQAAGRRWADLQQALGARSRHGRSVNLDPAALLLDMILKIDEVATELAARPESRS